MERNFVHGSVLRDILEDTEKRKKAIETRTIPFVISSEAKDRHRTVVNMKGWRLENYENNPIVGYQHNVYGGNMCMPDNPDDVIGSSRIYFEEVNGKRVMMGDVTFEKAEVNPQAEKIFQKVLAGTLRAASVGFLEIGKGKRVTQRDDNGNIVDETYFFEGQELLEWSIVNIPSNPEATARSLMNHTRAGLNFLRNLGMDKARIRKIVEDILEGIEEPNEDEPKENQGPDPNLNNYQKRLSQFKK